MGGGQKDPIAKKIDDLVAKVDRIDNMDQEIKEISGKLSKLDILTGLAKSVDENAEKMEKMEALIVKLEGTIKKREEDSFREIESLKEKIDYLENQLRRNTGNVVIVGIKENELEPWSVTSEIVSQFFKDKLELDIMPERAHRLGARKKDKHRPIIVCLPSYLSKISILSNCKKLKGTGLYVNEDFSEKIRKERQELVKYAKEKFKGERYKLQFNSLYVENKKYKVGFAGVYQVN